MFLHLRSAALYLSSPGCMMLMSMVSKFQVYSKLSRSFNLTSKLLRKATAIQYNVSIQIRSVLSNHVDIRVFPILVLKLGEFI